MFVISEIGINDSVKHCKHAATQAKQVLTVCKIIYRKVPLKKNYLSPLATPPTHGKRHRRDLSEPHKPSNAVTAGAVGQAMAPLPRIRAFRFDPTFAGGSERPPYLKLTNGMVRYQIRDLMTWLGTKRITCAV